MWLYTQDTSSWDRNPPKLYAKHGISPLSHINDIRQLRNYNAYILAFVCLYFALSNTRMLNLLEELCITRVAAVNSFRRGACVYICIYIYIHWSYICIELISVFAHTHTHARARTHTNTHIYIRVGVNLCWRWPHVLSIHWISFSFPVLRH